MLEKLFHVLISVSNGDVTFSANNVDEETYHIEDNGNGAFLLNNIFVNGDNKAETYSVNYPIEQILKKPKPGVLQKFNLVLRRLFQSKL